MPYWQPMVVQTAALYDVLLYGAVQPLEGREIKAPQRPIQSQMVQMAYDADEIIQEQNIQIPLFW